MWSYTWAILCIQNGKPLSRLRFNIKDGSSLLRPGSLIYIFGDVVTKLQMRRACFLKNEKSSSIHFFPIQPYELEIRFSIIHQGRIAPSYQLCRRSPFMASDGVSSVLTTASAACISQTNQLMVLQKKHSIMNTKKDFIFAFYSYSSHIQISDEGLKHKIVVFWCVFHQELSTKSLMISPNCHSLNLRKRSSIFIFRE